MLHEQPVQMAPADSDVRGDLPDVKIIPRIVEVDELDRTLNVFVAVFLLGIMAAEPFHQRGKKNQERGGHPGFVAGARPGGAVNIHQKILKLVVPVVMEQGSFQGKARFAHQPARIRSVEPYPAVFPGVLMVRLVRRDAARHDQKAVSCGKGIMLFPAVEFSLPGQDVMDQVMIPHARPPGMVRSAAL